MYKNNKKTKIELFHYKLIRLHLFFALFRKILK